MSDAPPKFIKIDGVKKINPEWKAWKAGAGASAASSIPSAGRPTSQNEATSLAVITNTNDLAQCGSDVQAHTGYTSAIEDYKTNKAAQVGLSSDNAFDELARVFGKFEIPMGLLQKLFMLSDFDLIQFLNDDSGSMDCRTDALDSDGKPMTRFQEMQQRIKMMFELFAYVPTPPIEIRWMNNTEVTTIEKKQGETPQQFYERACQEVDHAFRRGTLGSTPAVPMVRKSFEDGQGKNIVRYFFGDGVPNGGSSAINQLSEMVKNRENPAKNPFSFMACTNDDEAVSWMGDIEERAPFCSAYDDYNDEAREVLLDQGKAFPMTLGLYLICLCVGAIDPVLDNLDESSPLTKPTMSAIMGYEVSQEEYEYYFKEFMIAQKKHRCMTGEDFYKYHYALEFEKIFPDFCTAPVASELPLVQEYRKNMNQARSIGNRYKHEIQRQQEEELERTRRIERINRDVLNFPSTTASSRRYEVEVPEETEWQDLMRKFKKEDPRNSCCVIA